MHERSLLSGVIAGSYLLIQVAFLARAVLRPHREPASRIAWVAVMLGLPIVGIAAYVLLGETSIGRRRVARVRDVLGKLPPPGDAPGTCTVETTEGTVPERHRALFRAGRSVNGFPAVEGSRVRLLADSNAAIDSLVADIDAAREHVHLNFYIWLPDTNGLKVVEALKRAAGRGVACRAMADSLGSRILLGSEHWRKLGAAGVKTASALPIGNPLLRPLRGRIDLRNHRKIAVVDHAITYCGSQNCADPEFRVKAKFAPWVDVLARFEGPIAWQNQHLFATDWMANTDEDISELLRRPALPALSNGVVAQVIGTGPTVRHSAMPEVFETLMYAARRELVVTTPYYVPDESMQAALCAAARRGVDVTVVFPARNDSRIVGAASRSYYEELLDAGVRIFEFQPGLLHAKTLTLDGEITLLGSANMDRRSFELNYENNILLYDAEFTGAMRRRQEEFLDQSRPVTAAMVAQWAGRLRLWNNTMAMLGPVL